MSATPPTTIANPSPTTELESPVVRMVAEHGQLMTVTALRLMTVLALEKVRRDENRLTLKQLAEVTRLPVETVREVLHTLREQGSLLVTDQPAINAADPEDEDAIDAACYGDGLPEPPPVEQIGVGWTVGVR